MNERLIVENEVIVVLVVYPCMHITLENLIHLYFDCTFIYICIFFIEYRCLLYKAEPLYTN